MAESPLSRPASSASYPTRSVHLWWLPLGAAPAAAPADEATLTAPERARADQFVFPADRARFVSVRAAVRTVLAGELGCRPARVPLSVGPYGRPTVDAPELDVNVTHSRSAAVIAVTRGGSVGIDLADPRPGIDWARMARRCFTAAEWHRLRHDPAGIERAALPVWAAKEAWLKCLGVGLRRPMDSFHTIVQPGTGRGIILDPVGPAVGTLLIIDAGPFGAAAVAVPGRRQLSLTHHRFPGTAGHRPGRAGPSGSPGGRSVQQRFGDQPGEAGRVVHEEVSTRNDGDPGGRDGQLPPRPDRLEIQQPVGTADGHADRTPQQRPGLVPVSGQQQQVSANPSQVGGRELLITEHRRGGSAVFTEHPQQVGVRQVGVTVIGSPMRGLQATDDQLRRSCGGDAPRGFVREHRPHAVPEQARRQRWQGGQPAGRDPRHVGQSIGGRARPGDHQVHRDRQLRRPPPQRPRVTAGVRETHQPDGRPTRVVRRQPGQFGALLDDGQGSRQGAPSPTSAPFGGSR